MYNNLREKIADGIYVLHFLKYFLHAFIFQDGSSACKMTAELSSLVAGLTRFALWAALKLCSEAGGDTGKQFLASVWRFYSPVRSAALVGSSKHAALQTKQLAYYQTRWKVPIRAVESENMEHRCKRNMGVGMKITAIRMIQNMKL